MQIDENKVFNPFGIHMRWRVVERERVASANSETQTFLMEKTQVKIASGIAFFTNVLLSHL